MKWLTSDPKRTQVKYHQTVKHLSKKFNLMLFLWFYVTPEEMIQFFNLCLPSFISFRNNGWGRQTSGQGEWVRGSRESKEGERINLREVSLVAIVCMGRRTIEQLHLSSIWSCLLSWKNKTLFNRNLLTITVYWHRTMNECIVQTWKKEKNPLFN